MEEHPLSVFDTKFLVCLILLSLFTHMLAVLVSLPFFPFFLLHFKSIVFPSFFCLFFGIACISVVFLFLYPLLVCFSLRLIE